MSKTLIFFLKTVSILPFGLLELFSSLCYFILYRILGYRKNVVRTNLERSFPEKSKAERLLIEKKFYRFFCELIFEVIKNYSLPSSKVASHLELKNPELLDKLAAKSKGLVIIMGHYGNWEFCLSLLNLKVKQELYGLYKPFKNSAFQELLNYERTRHGLKLIAMKSALRTMLSFEKPSATVFIADQSPSNVDTLWTKFLNQETAVFMGPERIAKKLGHAVVYMRVKRTQLAKYQLEFVEICEDASKTTDNEISLKQLQLLEEDIRREPHLWLWSHKRWKRKRPVEIPLVG